MITWRTVLATAAGVVAALALALVAVTWCWNRGGVCPGSPRGPHYASLRQISALLVAGAPDGMLPMKDGSLDVYALARSGDLSGTNLNLFREAFTKAGPTDDEIARGDYTNLRWERYRGDGRLEGLPFPLLWDEVPDAGGGRMVALSDGSVRYMEGDADATALKGSSAR